MNDVSGRTKAWLWGFSILAALCRQAPAAPSGPPLDPARRPALTRVVLQYQMDTLELEKRDGIWWVARLRLPADSVLVNADLDRLFGLQGSQVASSAKKPDLESFGLQVEEARSAHLFFSSGAPVKLRLGATRADPAHLYWKLEGKPEIFREQGRTGVVTVDPFEAVDRHLVPPFWPAEVETVQVAWVDSVGRGQGYTLFQKSADTVWMLTPEKARLHRVKAWDVLGQVPLLAIDGLPATDETVPVPPAVPAVSLRIVLKNGARYSVQSGAAEGPYYYVRHPRSGAWVKLRRNRLDGFRFGVAYLTTGPVLGAREDDGTRSQLELRRKPFGMWAPHEDSHGDDDSAHEEEGSGP